MGAALAEKRLVAAEDEKTRASLETWLIQWHKQVDSTLELLYSSATRRGVAHRLTRNLGLFTRNYVAEVTQTGPTWNGQHPPKAEARRVKPQSEAEALENTIYTAIGEAVRFAEGHSGITLGRLPSPATIKSNRKRR